MNLIKLYDEYFSREAKASFSFRLENILNEKGSTAEFAELILEVLREMVFIFTFDDTDETYFIYKNNFYKADAHLKQFMHYFLSNVTRSAHRNPSYYDQALKLIKVMTYVPRRKIFSQFNDIIAFNNAYLNIKTFEIVKPSLSFIERIIDYFENTHMLIPKEVKMFDGNTKLVEFARAIIYKDGDLYEIMKNALAFDSNHFVEGVADYEYYIHQPFFELMSMLPIRKLDVDFDPTAKPRLWLEFIQSSVPPQYRTTLQRFMGYCLLPTKKFQKFLVLLGEGSNGKTVFLTVMQKIFGKYVSSLSMQDIVDKPFKLAHLEGKMVNIYTDLPTKKIFNTGIFKALVADDTPITVEEKYKPPREAYIYAKLIFAANMLPPVSDDSYAFFRRWIIIPFPRKFEGKNAIPDLTEKLLEEKSAILNWILAGLYHLLEDEYSGNPFCYPHTIEEVVERYYRAQSPVAAFVQDCIIEEVGNQEIEIEKEALYRAFVKYCRAEGLPVLSQHKFTIEFKKHSMATTSRRRVDGTRKFFYVGITWSPQCPDGEWQGRENDEIWDLENDFYLPEELPPQIYAVWNHDIRKYKVVEEVEINGRIYTEGEEIWNIYVSNSELRELERQGKIVKVYEKKVNHDEMEQNEEVST